jgi:predicted secreted protein
MSAILSAGTILQLNISGTYTSLANITSIGGPNMTCSDVDITTLLSTSRWKEFISGFKDGGLMNLDANYLNTLYLILFNNFSVANTWRLIFIDSSKMDFSGYINALSDDAPLEEEVGMPFAVKLTGVPTYTQ